MENESGSFRSHQKVQYKLHVVVTGWAVPAPADHVYVSRGMYATHRMESLARLGGGGRANAGPIGDVRKQQQHQPVV